MGGKTFNTQRKPSEQYKVIESEFDHYLNKKVGSGYRIPRYYASKPDFGDIDIIIAEGTTPWVELRQSIIDDFGITRYKQNGPVFSAVYQDFHLDCILCAPEHLDTMYHYMSFNDVGNLLGKIFRRFGLKYGNKGLSYVFRRESNESYTKDIEVSLDIERILAFIEVDVKQWHEGFDTLEAIFQWLTASPYFSVAPYFNPQKTMRKRVRKRPTVEKFVAYLKAHNISKTYTYLEEVKQYHSLIAGFFPEAGLTEAIEAELEKEIRDNRVAQKFNGKLVMAWLPELKGKALGEFIQAFKASFDELDDKLDTPFINKTFEEVMVNLPEEEVKQRVLAFYLDTKT